MRGRKILSDDACAARTYGRTCRHRMEIWSFFIKRKESGSWLFSEKRRDHADWCASEFKPKERVKERILEIEALLALNRKAQKWMKTEEECEKA